MNPVSDKRKAAFEVIVLGSGGGPLETDCSGYLVKPLGRRWEDGLVGLEGGSGLGALANLLSSHPPENLFPGLDFPSTHHTPVLKAAYVFSLLTCYLLTHAHLDHVLSLILLSGSIPAHPTPKTEIPSLEAPSSETGNASTSQSSRTPIYATTDTLRRLSLAYGGEIWPELGSWGKGYGELSAANGAAAESHRKRRRKAIGIKTAENIEAPPATSEEAGGSGVSFNPLTPSKVHLPLHPTLPISTFAFPVAHGATSHGLYESSAMFIRYDPSLLPDTTSTDDDGRGREFLFFGDVESGWRPEGEEGVNHGAASQAVDMNRVIWEEAARSIRDGRLGAIFIECSYDSSRAPGLMYGHMSPPALYFELKTLASLLPATTEPLKDLKVYITHIKESLVPHPTGLSARELITNELRVLEEGGKLGVQFISVRPGDRLVI